MALTITEVDHRWAGNQREVTADIDFDTSYPTGGESVTADDFGLGTIENLVIESGVSNGGYVARWDDVNENIQMFEAGADGTPLDEVADLTDLSAESIRVTVRGRS